MSLMSSEVVVIVGAGGIGQAIARRQGAGRQLLLADRNEQTLQSAADALTGAGYAVQTHPVDVASPESVSALAAFAASLGPVMQVVHTAGLSPVQAPPAAILAVDLLGTALVLDAFGAIIASGGAGLVIASMAGHMLPALDPAQDHALSQTPSDQLLALPFLQPDVVSNSGAAYALSKRANSLRVQAASLTWGDRGARVNAMSPGIILTPLAQDELNSAGRESYLRMIENSPAGRVGTTDEIAAAAAFLLGPEAGFITGSDLLIDGGVIAAMRASRITLGAGN